MTDIPGRCVQLRLLAVIPLAFSSCGAMGTVIPSSFNSNSHRHADARALGAARLCSLGCLNAEDGSGSGVTTSLQGVRRTTGRIG